MFSEGQGGEKKVSSINFKEHFEKEDNMGAIISFISRITKDYENSSYWSTANQKVDARILKTSLLLKMWKLGTLEDNAFPSHWLSKT